MTGHRSRPAIAIGIMLVSLTAACTSATTAHRRPAADAGGPRDQVTASSASSTPTTTGHTRVSDLKPTCRVLAANLALLERAATQGGNADLPRAIAGMRALERSAPVEIRADVKVIADFDQDVVDAITTGSSTGVIRETPQLRAALTHEATWVSKHCP
jgi:hypothetical protein